MAQVQQITENLTFYRGDSCRLQMTWINEDDDTGAQAPVDFTNLEVSMQFRFQPDDLTIVFSLPWIQIGDPKDGVGYFYLTKTQSEQLAEPYGTEKRTSGSYDIQFWSKLDPEAAFSPMKGSWNVQLDVTRKK